jgi:hypothetical protein
MKTHHKLNTEQDQKKPKRYATILKYISNESMEALQTVKEWSKIEESIDPECLWNAVQEKHCVHSTS